jgi:hypothetical protein
MTERQEKIFALIGMYCMFGFEDRRKYRQILKIMFPKQFENLED